MESVSLYVSRTQYYQQQQKNKKTTIKFIVQTFTNTHTRILVYKLTFYRVAITIKESIILLHFIFSCCCCFICSCCYCCCLFCYYSFIFLCFVFISFFYVVLYMHVFYICVCVCVSVSFFSEGSISIRKIKIVAEAMNVKRKRPPLYQAQSHVYLIHSYKHSY